jgi:hypothetical protein
VDSEDLAARYERILRDAVALTRQRTDESVEAENRLSLEVIRLSKLLRESPAGRRAIERLARDPDRLVRATAAAHCLRWNPSLGRAVLEEVRDGHDIDGPGWDQAGFDAKWTLKMFDAGRLNLD